MTDTTEAERIIEQGENAFDAWEMSCVTHADKVRADKVRHAMVILRAEVERLTKERDAEDRRDALGWVLANALSLVMRCPKADTCRDERILALLEARWEEFYSVLRRGK